MADIIAKKLNEIYKENTKDHGGNSMTIVADTNPVSAGNYYGILVLSDAVIASITYKTPSMISGTLTGITLFSGLYIPITAGLSTLTLTSGKVILYS